MPVAPLPLRTACARAALVVGLLSVAAGLPAPAQARPPRDFVGFVSEDIFAGNSRYRSFHLRRQRAMGSGLLRQTFNWANIERAPERYRWVRYDKYVLTTARYRRRILAIVFSAPGWHSTAPTDMRQRKPGATYPPEPRAFARFAALLVQRYGPNGQLWREHPTARKLPITSWQIWNEPNIPAYWPTGPNASEYVELLRASNAAIKAVDPNAEVVTAGVPQSRLGIPLLRYVADMYAAGAKDSFDTLAVNPYARTIRDLGTRLRKVRLVMNRAGDPDAGIWVTELGWSDRGPYSPFRAGPRGQARLVGRAIDLLGRRRRALKIRGFVYTFYRDSAPYPPKFKDFWGLHTGLLRRDGTRKPAFRAFTSAVRRLR